MQTSSARYFPFTKQAFKEFKINEQGRRSDARKLLTDLRKRARLVFQEMQVVKDQYTKSMAQWNNVKKQLEELERRVEKFGKPVDKLGQGDAFKRQADALKRQVDELEQRGDALEPRASALERRVDALCERGIQYRPRLEFFVQMYKEHQLKSNKTCHKN
ncbi:hypothetical protein CTI12_AA262890 [Artemisia annua]|uniref:Uncharacterized protein n=1 Tax=Artemisia annua TaxID=35608 RepID=A0A2U1NIE6_ARTAN|nr:hypothetical protein CTI12_AA262890 [Artemisia annua]